MYALFVYVDHKHYKANKGILKEKYYGNFG